MCVCVWLLANEFERRALFCGDLSIKRPANSPAKSASVCVASRTFGQSSYTAHYVVCCLGHLSSTSATCRSPPQPRRLSPSPDAVCWPSAVRNAPSHRRDSPFSLTSYSDKDKHPRIVLQLAGSFSGPFLRRVSPFQKPTRFLGQSLTTLPSHGLPMGWAGCGQRVAWIAFSGTPCQQPTGCVLGKDWSLRRSH